MDTFYCIGCRTSHVNARLGKLTSGAHRDGEPVGFCFACLHTLLPELAAEPDDDTVERGDFEDDVSA